MSLNGAGKLRASSGLGGVGGQFLLDSPTTVNDNEWHMGAFTWDGTTATDGARLYLDGIEVAVGTSADEDTGPSTNFLTIGNNSGSDNFFNGLLDDIAIYDRVLSSSEINDIFNGI